MILLGIFPFPQPLPFTMYPWGLGNSGRNYPGGVKVADYLRCKFFSFFYRNETFFRGNIIGLCFSYPPLIHINGIPE